MSESRILETIVLASQALLEARDLRQGLETAARLLGIENKVDRVYIFKYDQMHKGVRPFCTWDAPGMDAYFYPEIFLDSDFPEVVGSQFKGEVWHSTVDQRVGKNRELNDKIKTKSDVIVPILIRGNYWGSIGFDHCESERTWSETEVNQLKQLAVTISSTIIRFEYEEEKQRERERETEENLSIINVLKVVADSSKFFVNSQTLESGILRWLSQLGQVRGASRATLYDVVDFPETGKKTVRMLSEWVREGVQGSIPVSFSDPYVIDPRGAEEFIDQLCSGKVIVIHTKDCRGTMSDFMREHGNLSTLAVPIFKEGVLWGALSFDYDIEFRLLERDASILETAANVLGTALCAIESSEKLIKEKEIRIQSEKSKSKELLSINAEISQRESMFETVAAAARALLEGGDYDESIRSTLRLLCETLSLDRAALIQDIPTGRDDGPGMNLVTHEWYAPGQFSKRPKESKFGPYPSAEVWRKQRRGEIIKTTPQELDPDFGENQNREGVKSMIGIPIMIGNRNWGVMVFDDCKTKRQWSGYEVSIFETTSSCLAAAIRRREKETMVRAISEITWSVFEGSDLFTSFDEVLKKIAKNLRLDRTVLFKEVVREDGRKVHRVMNEWNSEQVSSLKDQGLLEIPNETAENMLQELYAGRPAWILTEDFQESGRSVMERLGVKSTGCVPIRVNGVHWGAMNFDDCTHARKWDPIEKDTILAVANVVSSALERSAFLEEKKNLELAALAEREKQVEEMKTLLKTTNNVLQSAFNLNGPRVEIDKIPELIALEIYKVSNASLLAWYDVTPDLKYLKVRFRIRNGVLVEDPEENEPMYMREVFRTDHLPHFDEWYHADEFIIMGINPDKIWPENYEWHRSNGRVEATAYPLKLGDQPLGVFGIGFDVFNDVTDLKKDIIRALSNQFALADQLSRLSSQVKREAEVLATVEERARIARDFHDHIAHDFLGVIMQLEAAQVLKDLSHEKAQACVQRALDLAREGVQSARRAVLALQSSADDRISLKHALEVVVNTHTSSSGPDIKLSVFGEDVQPRVVMSENLLAIVKESLMNALKHSKAKNIFIELFNHEDHFMLQVRDNGLGFDDSLTHKSGGLGHLSMQKRSERIGAKLEIHSQKHSGTIVRVLVSKKELD